MDDADPLRIRPMTLADCDRVSEIRVLGWQFAYRGLMPQPFLDALSAAADAERRRARFAESDGSVLNLVASVGDEIIGWAALGPYREGELRTEDAELYALYLDPKHVGTGAGRALMQEALRRAAALGHDHVYLWVVRGNARARRFYERAGFRADGVEEPYEVEGVLVPEVRYVRELSG
ncbi:GNAT family N-acetyltransferase [Streptomyces sp. NRRL F-525]|uniref:GNAT family N-acetyltransferase n=1 Tax=Streptomyces sp. NRRL F-525 TaxID=1463861 RepID=UPI000526178A|nr:GNAT family N-acetyltransferase [Streptomyces sp. NRRL F-525]